MGENRARAWHSTQLYERNPGSGLLRHVRFHTVYMLSSTAIVVIALALVLPQILSVVPSVAALSVASSRRLPARLPPAVQREKGKM